MTQLLFILCDSSHSFGDEGSIFLQGPRCGCGLTVHVRRTTLHKYSCENITFPYVLSNHIL